MVITLLTDHVWQTLTAATKTRVKPAVAVAYFGQGAAKLLPLPNGSRIVVDASEGAKERRHFNEAPAMSVDPADFLGNRAVARLVVYRAQLRAGFDEPRKRLGHDGLSCIR